MQEYVTDHEQNPVHTNTSRQGANSRKHSAINNDLIHHYKITQNYNTNVQESNFKGECLLINVWKG